MENLKIYRFQHNRFYGGITTAFCSECNLNCIFCYSQNQRNKGKYFTADDIGHKIIQTARKYQDQQCRISGGDPFTKYSQLIKVIEYIMENSNLYFILETNGIEIGRDEKIAEKLARFDNDRLIVRVSLKHIVGKKFHYLTGAPEKWSKFALKSIHYLKKYKVNTLVSWMYDWYNEEEISQLLEILIQEGYLKPGNKNISPDEWWEIQDEIDPEEFYPYRSVKVSRREILNNLNRI